VDEVSTDPAVLLERADVIILAAPVMGILHALRALPELCPGPAIVMDVGSTKTEIVRAMAELPLRFDPIGAHPMAGKERLSLANAEPGLFRGAPFAMTPLPRTTMRARRTAEQICQAIGSNPLWLEPEVHDRWVAATSHLPYLVSSALALATPEEAAPMVGTGFRSTARLAATPTSMMLDVLMTNPGHIHAAIRRLRDQLDQIDQKLVQSDFNGLSLLLNEARDRKEKLP